MDLCRLCPGQSLAGACKGFQTLPVKKPEIYSHLTVQDQYMEGGKEQLDTWLADNRAVATEYLVADVLCTSSLYVKLTDAIKELSGIDVLKDNAMTIGQVAWSSLAKTVELPPCGETKRVDEFFRKAITGGRTQNFKPRGYTTQGPLRMIDVASLYPSVMYGVNKELFPEACHYGRYPTGKETSTPAYIAGKIGVYRITVERQPVPNILPKRVPGEPLDWSFIGVFDTYASSCSIELIRHHGGAVEVHEGYYWETDTEDLFKTFLTPLFADKDLQDSLKKEEDPALRATYNPAKRAVDKLIMNSCSGKAAQRNFDDRVVLAKGTAQQLAEEAKMNGGIAMWIPLAGENVILVGKKDENKVYKTKGQYKSKPSQLSVMIYEYARTYMYHLLISRWSVFYNQTQQYLSTLQK